MAALAPGATIGIIGGGQLGRMLALAAARLGFKTHVYAPAGDNPAFDVATAHTEAAYEDERALAAFADAVGMVTYEFENIPAHPLTWLAQHTPLKPSADVLAFTQDRWAEKSFLSDLGLPVAAFANVETPADLAAAVERVGLPLVLKTRRFGYDGKGQVMVRRAEDMAAAWEQLGRVPCIAEGFVDFACEAAMIAARNATGEIVTYDMPRTVHEDHVLRRCHVPAGLPAGVEAAGTRMARQIAEAFDYEGVLAVEFFVMRDDAGARLLINEIAPRVHNSGHWTEAACAVSQFEMHIRAIAGWPLPEPARHSDCVMENLLGAEADDWQKPAAEDGAVLHLYGKREARPGRKMGHLTRLKPR